MDGRLHNIKSPLRNAVRRLKSAYGHVRPKRTIRIGPKSYALPSTLGTLLSLHPGHEPWLDWVYEVALQSKEGTFVDVGVNRGQTLAKLLRLAPNNRYIGLEPQPGCVFYVDEFFRINGLENCRILPIALSDHAGLVELSLHSQADGDSTASIARRHRPTSFYVQSKWVPAFPGDEVFPLLPDEAISIVKIDVEGAELEVLRGLSNTLHKYQPFVVFEVLNNYLSVTRENLTEEMTEYRNDRARQISSYFDGLDYTVFNIRGTSLILSEVITPEVSADLSITDYLAVPKELVPQIQSMCDVRSPTSSDLQFSLPHGS